MLEELKKHNALVQERIMKSFGYKNTDEFIQKSEDVNTLIQKGEIDYDFELEKAVYADTAENRKLGRVGQEYHRGRKKSGTEDGMSSNKQVFVADADTQKKMRNHMLASMHYEGEEETAIDIIDKHPTDYYRKIMKKYGVNSAKQLFDEKIESGDSIDVIWNMVRKVPISDFYEYFRDDHAASYDKYYLSPKEYLNKVTQKIGALIYKNEDNIKNNKRYFTEGIRYDIDKLVKTNDLFSVANGLLKTLSSKELNSENNSEDNIKKLVVKYLGINRVKKDDRTRKLLKTSDE